MTIYTAKKPCKFGGKEFSIGDSIPAELIAPGRAKTLVEYKVISVTEVADEPSEKKDNDTAATDQQPEAVIEAKADAENEGEGEQAEIGSEEQLADQQPEANAEKPKATGKKGAKK